ncbi:MAG: type II toxin-antitoxin system VapC family toxin [Actinomycetota bacterium]|nr:type II toxin-antitoxin system VapC family toxin [Actinomycetota bacterium]
MVVVDTSAIVTLLIEEPPVPALASRLSDLHLHAPHLIDVEFLHAVRRLVATRRITLAQARLIRADFAGLRMTRYPHGLLLDRMWDLRDNLSAYDAAFVALSEALDLPLVTTDARLARAPGHHAVVESY